MTKAPRYTYHFNKSMYPLLQNRDILNITQTEQINKGDIVLFKGIEKEEWIAHRVIKIEKKNIYTKGDNNHAIDNTILHPSDIVGIVTERWRNGKKLTIYRGKKSLLQHRFYLIYIWGRNLLKKSIGNLFIPKLIQPFIRSLFPKPKEAIFHKFDQQKRVLYLGKIHIGIYSEMQKTWKIRFPYRILYGNNFSEE